MTSSKAAGRWLQALGVLVILLCAISQAHAQAAPAPPTTDEFKIGSFTFKPGGRNKLDIIRDFDVVTSEDSFDPRTIALGDPDGGIEARATDPLRQWKLSPMDLPSRERWYDYSRARDIMLKKTDTPFAPWYIVPSDDKRAARPNTIAHLLSAIPHKKLPTPKVTLPKRSSKGAYDDDASIAQRRFVAERYKGEPPR